MEQPWERSDFNGHEAICVITLHGNMIIWIVFCTYQATLWIAIWGEASFSIGTIDSTSIVVAWTGDGTTAYSDFTITADGVASLTGASTDLESDGSHSITGDIMIKILRFINSSWLIYSQKNLKTYIKNWKLSGKLSCVFRLVSRTASLHCCLRRWGS